MKSCKFDCLVQTGTITANKLGLTWAKLKLSYIEVKVEVVVKAGEEVVVETRVQLLVRRVVGGWSDKTKLMLNSAFN